MYIVYTSLSFHKFYSNVPTLTDAILSAVFPVQNAAVRAKKSGRLLCEEPIQIFWHSRPLQRPRPDPHVPVPVHPSSHSQDPRLAQTRFETGQRVADEQGQGGDLGGSEEEANGSSMFQAGRKRPADVAGLETVGGRRREGGGREGGGREGGGREGGRGLVGGSGGKKSVWDRLGGIDGEESNQPGTTKVPHLPLIH